MQSPQNVSEATNGIKQNALLLLIARDYLCDDVFFIKIGKSIEQNIIRLKDEISSLKKVFPGKLQTEVKTEAILESISATAKSLIEQSNDLKENCISGELGRKLAADTKSIAGAVNLLKIQVMGRGSVYQGKRSSSGILTGLKDIFRPLWDILMIGAKILSLLIIIAIALFLYLYFTMEKEGALLKPITESRTLISNWQERISQLEMKKMELLEEKGLFENEAMKRENKLVLMDLEMEIQNVNQERSLLEAEIIAHQSKINANLEKIKEINKKTFLKRLLRQ